MMTRRRRRRRRRRSGCQKGAGEAVRAAKEPKVSRLALGKEVNSWQSLAEID